MSDSWDESDLRKHFHVLDTRSRNEIAQDTFSRVASSTLTSKSLSREVARKEREIKANCKVQRLVSQTSRQSLCHINFAETQALFRSCCIYH